MSDEQDPKTEETADVQPVHGPVDAAQDAPAEDPYGAEGAEPKTEAKPEDEERHPLDVAREQGSRVFPTWQTGNIDTSAGGPVDLRTVSPVFEHTREDLVRHAADVFDPDTDTADDTVILPEDKEEADAVKDKTAAEAASLPERSYFGGGEPGAPAEETAAQDPSQGEEDKPENG